MIDSQESLVRAVDGTLVRSVEFHTELHSTNDRAIEIASNATLLPKLILAHRQTRGRGRGANRWWASEGSLTCSLLINPQDFGFSPEQSATLSLIVALAVGRTLGAYSPHPKVAWKWPNDVYLGDRKVCGILLEAPSSRPPRLVIGVGINVNVSPKSVVSQAAEEIHVASLSEATGQRIEMAELLQRLLLEFQLLCQNIQSGVTRLDDAWYDGDFLRERRIRVTGGSQVMEGVAEGINPDGALRLAQPGGSIVIRSGTGELTD